MHKDDINSHLAKDPWFNNIPKQLAEKLLDCAHIQPFEQGQVLHWQQDEKVEGLYFVQSGVIKVSSNSHEGKEAVLTYLPPGTWFGEIAVFDGLHRTHTATAHEHSQLIRIPKDELLTTIGRYPELYAHIIKLLCEKIRLLMAALEDSALQSLPIRLARRLLTLAQSFGITTDKGVEIKLRLPQEELGQMLGISRQSTNKLLKNFERQGMISAKYRHIVLTDINKIKCLNISKCN